MTTKKWEKYVFLPFIYLTMALKMQAFEIGVQRASFGKLHHYHLHVPNKNANL